MKKIVALLTILLWGAGSWAGTPNAENTKRTQLGPQPRVRLADSAQRNENVAVYQIDNNAVKEVNVRLGNRASILQFGQIESGYFATEHGQPPAEVLVLAPPASRVVGWHGDLFYNHQNSVFNARTFFQVGPVQPSRRNQFGFRATGAAGPLGFLTITGAQRQIRGMVNGNVLVPLAGERTPLATDPATRAIVQRFLDAYPDALPNRLDFDPRALNTNAPQHIDDTDGLVRLDRSLGKNSRLSISHNLVRQQTDAFQLVAGQNPDMEIHSHRTRITLRSALSATTELALGASFQRTRSLLVPEPNAVGPRVRFGFQIEELGPDSQFPINRAQNSFRYGAQIARQSGSHATTFGGDFTRFQLNGIETNNQRGYFQFTNNFGRSAIENLRLGTPSSYEVTLGELSRGYRNWMSNVYAADRWRIHPRIQLYLGLRYSIDSAPREVDGLDTFPYDSDANNFSPRVAIAVQMPLDWVMRAAATTSFAPLQPVTYQQVRNNAPLVRYIQLQAPLLSDPLRGIDITAGRVSPTLLSPDLADPYSHQYNFSLEKRFLDKYVLRAGYVGSRSFKLINSYVFNRAENVAGIPLTLATVDARRADPRYYEVKNIVNAGIAYFDAGQASFEVPLRNGLAASATYTFSKAIDEGSDFSSTAANRDLLSNRSQSQYDSLKDRKGLSNFHSPHSVTFDYSYQLPNGRHAWLRGWQLSGATLVKAGTPLTLYIGSDSPGFGNVDGGPSDRPNIVDASILGTTIDHPNSAPLILRRDRFAYITPGEYRGSVGRNTFRKAGIANWNAAVAKQWTFRGRREWSALLRCEAYNLTNTPQFDEPQRNLSSPSFGRITNTLNDGRVLQLGLRVLL
jgi:hypothetical protein